ncbi:MULTISPECIES: DegT/DnrJ/EryC1/StrS aminotransferase family protein [unclassified Kitasatospora]|uniref:DegT/DnrJ/EryC1/StrS family aminotransferase n=1 Tax=unclassified Kitasatospora TaxID=2633591 RepID=UPI000710EEEA|nr:MULTISPECIES: DegT/DnrJ/EryC1/StrS family aminotransferase [unclassified Kitasatospora]KQV11733.1 aminotransferase DegT [Kitasatospora sp. Root107]KRB76685.1 aminotransferase DegT [Kitasatospora sp. Root187]
MAQLVGESVPTARSGAGVAGAGVVPVARPVIGEAEIAAAVRVLRSGSVVQGPEVAAFEREFAELVDGRHCVAVNSGTSALQLALTALGIGPGDEVVVPSFSFAATANAVRLVGAEPVFADIDPDSFCLDPAAVLAAIGPRTAALLPVHLYGHPASMAELTRLAVRNGLAVVEDACQAHGATLDGRPVGSFGAAGCFSFYPTKNMHALEGGMVTVADPALARKLRLLRNQGMEQPYRNEIVGANLRMTDVSAAVGRVQLGRLPEATERRRANAAMLDWELAATGLGLPPVAAGARHVYHQYTVRVRAERDRFRRELAEAGVGSEVYYPVPIHRLPPYPGRWELPETERAAAEVVALPVHPTLSEAELALVVRAVRRAV